MRSTTGKDLLFIVPAQASASHLRYRFSPDGKQGFCCRPSTFKLRGRQSRINTAAHPFLFGPCGNRAPSLRVATLAPAASASGDLVNLSIQLVEACLEPSLNRGLAIDPDAAMETDFEALVEDLAEQVEDSNTCAAPTTASEVNGSWELLYTSSTLTRFHGGLSGLHKFVEGSVGRITQEIDMESGTSTFYETIIYELPLVKKAVEAKVIVSGKIRAVNATRQMWVPESIKASWFQIWAESWKSVRAFTVAETTYLDDQLRITRGQTGSLTIFGRTQAQKT